MSPEQFLESLKNEWLLECKKSRGKETILLKSIGNCYTYFYLHKNYEESIRKSIFREMLTSLFRQRVQECLNYYNKKRGQITIEEELNFDNEFHDVSELFSSLLYFQSDDFHTDIVGYLSFFKSLLIMEFKSDETSYSIELNSRFVPIYSLFSVIKRHKMEHNNEIPHVIHEALIELLESNFWNSQINEILTSKYTDSVYTSSSKQEKRIITVSKLSTEKQWVWLQQHTLGFARNRADFYSLIEQLSQIDFFDKFSITNEIKQIMNQIDAANFEDFVLEIHRQTIEDSKARSNWFIADKVVSYQIFVWILFNLKTANCYEILTKIVEKCFVKIKRVGPTSRKLGDIILQLFYESQTIEGLGSLIKLKSRSKYDIFLEQLEIAIAKAVNYSKLDPSIVEDLFINDYGLCRGEISSEFGEYKAKLKIHGINNFEVTWEKVGRQIKNEPSFVKKQFPDELKKWKSIIQSIKKDFSGQKNRIENFWRRHKKWDYLTWKKNLLDHELIGFITKMLIWEFRNENGSQTAIFFEGNFIDSQKRIIDNIENSTVKLWHPATSSTNEITLWRSFILSNKINQPFKQAFREVYVITDCELEMSTFSKRFEKHVLRHFKFHALTQQRVWRYNQSNVYSFSDHPEIVFKDFGIKCVLNIESDSEYVITEKVVFKKNCTNTVLNVNEIPIIIFSESMRDIDLFVGVCSIGLDETCDNNFFEYWKEYSNSDLLQSAQIRKDLIKNIISQLPIRNRCEIDEKYLIINGKIKKYKIHLGSGNILMEPNDQHLCIVPEKKMKTDNKLFIPFEDDEILSIIISKAIMLADDENITDPYILKQINLI